jgi:hypothetical protein
MDGTGLPSSILLYIAGATSVVGVLVNGIRTAVVLPPVVSFLGACLLGFVFVVLFAVANNVEMTGPLWAASVIAGVMVGGASAGSNAVHSRSLPVTAPPTPDGDTQPSIPTVDEIAKAVLRERAAQLRGRFPDGVDQPDDLPDFLKQSRPTPPSPMDLPAYTDQGRG